MAGRKRKGKMTLYLARPTADGFGAFCEQLTGKPLSAAQREEAARILGPKAGTPPGAGRPRRRGKPKRKC